MLLTLWETSGEAKIRSSDGTIACLSYLHTRTSSFPKKFSRRNRSESEINVPSRRLVLLHSSREDDRELKMKENSRSYLEYHKSDRFKWSISLSVVWIAAAHTPTQALTAPIVHVIYPLIIPLEFPASIACCIFYVSRVRAFVRLPFPRDLLNLLSGRTDISMQII